MELTVNILINATKPVVWPAITDIDHCAGMISGIIESQVLERPDTGLVGLKWTETRKIFGKESSETMWITEAVDKQYYCTRAENCGVIYKTKVALTALDGKTNLSMSFSGTSDSFFTQLLSSVMGFFMKKTMIKMLEADLLDIKTSFEKSH